MKALAKTVLSYAAYYGGLWGPYFRLKLPGGMHGAAVLTFHRLVEMDTDILCKGPTVHTPVMVFEALIRRLTRYYRVASLGEIVSHLASGEPFESDTLAIVFDDGYEDNFRLGLPILKRYKVPATIFLATGFIDNKEPLWLDRVELALRRTRCEQLDTAEFTNATPALRLPLATRRERERANFLVGELLKGLDASAIMDAVARLERHLGVSGIRGERTMLTWKEVRALAQSGLDIGSHGSSHVIMTRMPIAEAAAELNESKRRIEAELQQPVRHFAYPNGREQDFNEALRQECRALGYHSVSTCVYGLNRSGVDTPYHIRRIGIADSIPVTLLDIERLFRRGAAPNDSHVRQALS
jgi:peptidoglycan/xylan/chitin deacetylase (PgdA/CDA1 family)